MMEQGKEPHSISVKVLRLSRPVLADQAPLPGDSEDDVKQIDPRASRGYPDAKDGAFSLTPLLSLPTGFGTAFVGSTFSCTICANNELSEAEAAELSISSVHIGAEITTPSQSATLALYPEETDGDASTDGLRPRETAQKLLKFDLREDGAHTLAVNVSYEVTTTRDGAVVGRRTRQFKKLYQFAAVPCLSVRTKATDLISPAELQARDARQALEKKGERFALEAQLENLTEGPITLEKVTFNPKPPFMSVSLNWGQQSLSGDDGHLAAPTLSPRAIYQVCHVIAEDEGATGEQLAEKEMTKDGRVVLGTLSIAWRGPMGDPGVLSTGWLTSKRR